ncbi:MAG: ketoacyl-ACP synthase III [Spirochaetales bacterium]|nr:ketoacyl-ACP synthase III [Spirochaetales bacterium]
MQPVIVGTGSYLPERVVHNDELAKMMDTSDEWIYSHTGIHQRHIAQDDQACSDMAVEAAKRALEDAGLTEKDIDMIIVSTVTGDYNGFPSTAAVVQHKLNAPQAAAMDVSAACAGFIYGLETARGFLLAGTAKRILVIGSEILTRISDWSDRSTCVLFGDGAGAAVVELTEDRPWESALHAEGSGFDKLKRELGGSAFPLKEGEVIGKNAFLYMDGQAVYLFAVRSVGQAIKEVLDKAELTIDDIAYVVPHQANVRIIEAVCKRNKYDLDKFYMNIERTANTSSASIPLALDEMNKKGLLKKGDKIVLCGFGGGLTYGAILLEW